MEISHFVLLSVLCVRQAKTHLSHQAAQNEKNMFIYIANFEFSFCICICYWYFFLPFSFHCDWRRRRWWHRHHHGCRLRSKMTHGSLVARSIVSESQLDKHVTKHNFPFFHLSSSQSPTKSDFNLGDKWFHEGCERLLTKWNMKKVGKIKISVYVVSFLLQHCSKNSGYWCTFFLHIMYTESSL